MSIDIVAVFLLIASLTVALIGAVRLLRQKKKFLTVVFFAFGVVCSLLSTVYWVVYDLLRPGSRMPFAANEIAEWALFLLFASSLTTVFPVRRFPKREVIAAAVFAAANTVLWIAWSGEWVDDVLTGLCFGWFICCTVAALRMSQSLKKVEWIALGALSAVLILAQSATFFVPENLKTPLTVFCGVLLLAGSAYFALRVVIEMKRGGSGFALSASLFAWSTAAMYMSGEGGVYLAALLFSGCSFLLALLSLKKEVNAA